MSAPFLFAAPFTFVHVAPRLPCMPVRLEPVLMVLVIAGRPNVLGLLRHIIRPSIFLITIAPILGRCAGCDHQAQKSGNERFCVGLHDDPRFGLADRQIPIDELSVGSGAGCVWHGFATFVTSSKEWHRDHDSEYVFTVMVILHNTIYIVFTNIPLPRRGGRARPDRTGMRLWEPSGLEPTDKRIECNPQLHVCAGSATGSGRCSSWPPAI